MASYTISLEGPTPENALTSAGYIALVVICPLFYPALTRPKPDSPLALPHVLACEGAVVLVLAFFNKAKGDGKSRLAWNQAEMRTVTQVIGLMPEEPRERTCLFGPASVLCRIKVMKKTKLVVLDAEVELREEEGARVVISCRIRRAHADY